MEHARRARVNYKTNESTEVQTLGVIRIQLIVSMF